MQQLQLLKPTSDPMIIVLKDIWTVDTSRFENYVLPNQTVDLNNWGVDCVGIFPDPSRKKKHIPLGPRSFAEELVVQDEESPEQARRNPFLSKIRQT